MLGARSPLYLTLRQAAARTDMAELASLTQMSRQPALVREREIAPVLGALGRARTPETVHECLGIIDDFHVGVPVS